MSSSGRRAAASPSRSKALVYIAGFIPDVGESAFTLATKFPGGVPQSALLLRPFATGLDVYVSPAQFRQVFAADLHDKQAAVMASTQRPIAFAAFTEASGLPAWKSIPTWAMVATEDNAIGTANARFMANRAAPTHTVEIDASHAVLISQSDAVEDLIRTADSATR